MRRNRTADLTGAAAPANAADGGHKPAWKMQSGRKSKQAGQGEATRGLHASNMAVRLTDVSDGACEE